MVVGGEAKFRRRTQKSGLIQSNPHLHLTHPHLANVRGLGRRPSVVILYYGIY